MLSWRSDQIVIVYVPRAGTKKNFEKITVIMLVLGQLALGAPLVAPLSTYRPVVQLTIKLCAHMAQHVVLKENTKKY